MDKNEIRNLALDTVIRYAAEQGVKLRRSDFPETATSDFYLDTKFQPHWRNCVSIIQDGEKVVSVMVKITYTGRWEKQLKKAKERFLNYYNARLEEHYLSFSFTANELEIIAIKRGSREKTEDDEKIERIIEKINKLLALSDQSRNNSEQEAIAASLQVQKLLAKYNLSMTDVTGERKEEEVEQTVADVGAGRKWKYKLASAIADNFACKSFFVGNTQIVFYGYKADVVSARRVFFYLFKVGDRLANQFAKRYREAYGEAEGIYNSFCEGFISGVEKELEKQCTALSIVVQPKVIEEWVVFSENFEIMNTDLASRMDDGGAYEEGFMEGKRALNAQYIE